LIEVWCRWGILCDEQPDDRGQHGRTRNVATAATRNSLRMQAIQEGWSLMQDATHTADIVNKGVSATYELAAFGHGLTLDAIPANVMQKAKEAIVDTVGVCIFGAGLPWGRMVIDYAQLYGAGGSGTILGTDIKVVTPFAALANGVLGHAFELDNLRQPSIGVHYGSTLVPALFAVGEEVHASGIDILAAFVAGSEVMSRIGLASDNTAEKLGFHSPGITGTYASTVAAGRLFGLTEEQMVRAFGIAGSLCSGLLAFSKAGNGGMVKRLHTGRASAYSTLSPAARKWSGCSTGSAPAGRRSASA
jgi:2-methylcitrate dehydratase PrpD